MLRGLQTIIVSMRKMSSVVPKLIEDSMRRKLHDALSPLHMEIINESHMHNVPKGSETHFKIVVVSNKFLNQPLIERHRIINKLLESEMRSVVHALSIVAKTSKQWEEGNKEIPESPVCRGGFGK